MTFEHFGNDNEEVTNLFFREIRDRDLLAKEIQQRNPEKNENKKPFPEESPTWWDRFKNVDTLFPDGKIPAKNEIIIENRKFLLDEGLIFVLVNKGDTRDEILKSVSKMKPDGRDLSYLKPGTSKYLSINIPATQLPAGRWIPLPIEKENRILTEKQFLNYASAAIDEILSPKTSRDTEYSEEVQALVKEIGKKELMCLALAVAKQESGGAPLGQFEFHRWESHRNDFSHSIFHIMLEGPGTEARKKLGMTPGQMNHPKNSIKFFLAFLIEKHQERFQKISAEKTATFLAKKYNDFDEFAVFYNGGNWKKTNPDYVENITKYFAEAKQCFEKTNTKESKKISPTEQTESSRKKAIETALNEALKFNSLQKDDKYIRSLNNSEKEQAIQAAEYLLEAFSPNNSQFTPTDSIRITADDKCIFVRLRRDIDDDWWGPKTISKLSNPTPEQKKKLSKETPPMQEKRKETSNRKLIEDEIRSRLQGNFWRSGEKNISIVHVSEDEIERATTQTILFLKKVAPSEPFDPKKHEIILTSDEGYIWIRIQRESDNSIVGGGATKVARDKK